MTCLSQERLSFSEALQIWLSDLQNVASLLTDSVPKEAAISSRSAWKITNWLRRTHCYRTSLALFGRSNLFNRPKFGQPLKRTLARFPKIFVLEPFHFLKIFYVSVIQILMQDCRKGQLAHVSQVVPVQKTCTKTPEALLCRYELYHVSTTVLT